MTCCARFQPQADVTVHVIGEPTPIELAEIRIRCGSCGRPRAFKLTAPPRTTVNGVSTTTTYRDRLHVSLELAAEGAPAWPTPPIEAAP